MSISIDHQTDELIASSQIMTMEFNGGLVVPVGNNSSQKPSVSGNNGLIRYNTDTLNLEAVINGVYVNLATTVNTGLFVAKSGDTMTGTLQHPAGSVGTPPITFTGSTTSGFYTPSAGIIGIVTGGTERLRVDASGNVSVGFVATAAAPLTVNKNTSALPTALTGTVINLANSDTNIARITATSFGNYTAFTGVRANGTNASKTGLINGNIIAVFDAWGYTSSGAYSTGARATVGMFAAETWTVTTQGAYISLQTTTIGTTVLKEQVRLTDAGNVGIGISTPQASLDVSARTDAIILPTGTSAQRPNPAQIGMTRYNTDIQNLEIFGGPIPSWISFGTGQCQAQCKNLRCGNHPTHQSSRCDITCDQAILQDNNGHNIRCNTVAVTCDITTSGAGGLDTGVVAPSTWYHMWLINNGSTTNCIFSTSSTAPTLPVGYPFCARVGTCRTDGSGNFYRFTQADNHTSYQCITGSNTPGYPTLASGTAGDPVAGTYIPVDCTGFTPPTSTHIHVCVASQGHTTSGNRSVSCAPNNNFGSCNNNSTNPPPCYLSSTTTSGTTTSDCSLTGRFALESTNVYWASASGSGLLYCTGYEDNL